MDKVTKLVTHKATNDVNIRILLTGLIFLIMGSLIYLLDRSHTLFPLIPIQLNFTSEIAIFGRMGFYLPSLFHVVAFSLIGISLLRNYSKYNLACCLFWVMINLLFEIGQASSVTKFLKDHLFEYQHNAIINNILLFFELGTFDWKDMVSTVIGGFIAYSISWFIIVRKQ